MHSYLEIIEERNRIETALNSIRSIKTSVQEANIKLGQAESALREALLIINEEYKHRTRFLQIPLR
jgi:hypothetical protein